MLVTTGVRARLSDVAMVGVGLGLVGISAYAVLGLAGHTLAPREYAAVASLYLLIAVVGPGVFIAVEQETSREISTRISAGWGVLPAVRSATVIGAALAAAVIIILLALSPLLVYRVFGGQWSLLIAALVSVVGAAAVYVLRGLFSGQRRYGWYGSTLAAEGLARLLPCLALAVASVASAATFAFAFALGTLLAAATTVAGVRASTAGPLADLPRMARSVGFLVGASSLTLVVANIGPVVLTSRLGDDPRLAASFVSLFVLARIPLFLLSPVQAFLLPSLTATARRGESAKVRQSIRTVVLLVGAIGLVGTVGITIVGPWAARVFFNAPVELSALVAGLLGASTLMMMIAQIMQPALVALDGHRAATSAWMLGTVVFGALLFAPIAPLVAVLAAQVAGPAVVVVIMANALRASLTHRHSNHRLLGAYCVPESGPISQDTT